jgi:GTP-binding protein
MTFTVAIAGRPNVGKSTLFNRLIGKAMAIIDDTPGVTRDWREGEARLFDLRFRLLDTAGLEDRRPKGSLAARTAGRTHAALGQADAILMMIDGREGVTPDDKAIARELRKTGKPVILLVNKCEGSKMPSGFDEAVTLGFDDPLAISATHGEGLGELHEALMKCAPDEAVNDAGTPYPLRGGSGRGARRRAQEQQSGDQPEDGDGEAMSLHIAIAGRPNAGKSTLVNSLIGEDRMLTGPEPGLTRDAIPVAWTCRGRPIRLVDTAGLRRRARIEEKLEKLSVGETLRAIRLAHVVILVIDAAQPFDRQDYTIAQHVAEEGRALVVAISKWDTVKEMTATLRLIKAKLEASLAQVSGVPLVTIAALNGEGLEKLMKEVTRVYEVWNRRVSTGQLNRWLEGMQADHPPPIVAGRRVKLRYMTQVKARPPTFALWVNKPVDLPDSYTRFLANGLRKAFGLEGVPLRWLLRKGKNPYEDEGRRKK